MRFGRAFGVSLKGLEGQIIGVEVHTSSGLPAFRIVGLPDTSLNEARDRVRAAIESCQLPFPRRRVTVGLIPADVPKTGALFDVAIAVGVLRAEGALPPGGDEVFIGELGLDGRIHPIRGVLPIVRAASKNGYCTVFVPEGNKAEAALIKGIHVVGVSHLAQVVNHLGGQAPIPAMAELQPGSASAEQDHAVPDFADLVGQHAARVAMEVAAAGGHHIFLSGPPGVGKTMLANRLPGILPHLTREEAITVTSVHSIAGTLNGHCLIHHPPFEAPHHSATMTALIGGGSGIALPGAVSRAHLGVLFLDESPEFSPRVLDALRQPLEHGKVSIHRAYGVATYPSRFQLVLAANPCPCGKGSGKGLQCECSPQRRRRYRGRLSGPLMDRIDIRVHVPPVRGKVSESGETSTTIRKRVMTARNRARKRLKDTPWRVNGHVPGPWYRKYTEHHAPAIMNILSQQLTQGRMSLRGVDRVLRLAWTVADLHQHNQPTHHDLSQAITLRVGGDDDGW